MDILDRRVKKKSVSNISVVGQDFQKIYLLWKKVMEVYKLDITLNLVH